ncbi:membrane bound O-acyl transferase family-domain-containing protein [Aspergillus egyptiacus]|nr:membrane bound O-acyl transferase family-domain-containing protein [Aspergillus egyptiacus]
MAESAFQRYERILLDTQKQLEARIQRGEAKPFLLWYAALPFLLPTIALLVPCRTKGWLVQPLLFTITLATSADIIRYQRAQLGGNGYMVGLIPVWWLVWSSTLLFFNDVERDIKRVERTWSVDANAASQQKVSSDKGPKLRWQSYPQPFLHRLGWVLALVINMRGPDFSFRISCLDPLPPQLDLKHRRHAHHKKAACPSAKSRLRRASLRFVLAYLAIDILKTIMIWDPYFFGAGNAPPPSFLDYFVTSPFVVRLYRNLVSGVGVYLFLHFVTSLNPICFLGLSSAFPNATRWLTATPLEVPWLYADQFGPITAVLDDGLAGAWGRWWHQIFRFGFVSTAKWIISLFPPTISSHRSIRRIIVTLVAFGISGLLHGFGSYTQLGDTRPFRGTFLFFILQAVGIFSQDMCSRILVALLTRHGLPPPRWLRRIGNVAFVLGWLFYTGNRAADEFAKGGMWLTEPLPVSLVRGLMGKGWLVWRTPWVEYYDDGTFWGRGWRVL